MRKVCLGCISLHTVRKLSTKGLVGLRLNAQCGTDTSAPSCRRCQCHLTLRWSARVGDKVPSSNVGARGAQLNR